MFKQNICVLVFVGLILGFTFRLAAQEPFGDISDLKLAKAEDKVDVPGTPAPPGAIVLFDGRNLERWQSRNGKDKADWKLVDGGIMEVKSPTSDIITKETFGGRFQLHVEFRSGYQPKATGQRRGNSGVYLQGRYEVQILDNYSLPGGQKNDCGAIYSVAAQTFVSHPRFGNALISISNHRAARTARKSSPRGCRSSTTGSGFTITYRPQSKTHSAAWAATSVRPARFCFRKMAARCSSATFGCYR